jgi:hypothetical protein
MKKFLMLLILLSSTLLAGEPSMEVRENSSSLVIQPSAPLPDQGIITSPFPHYFKRMLFSLGLLIGLLILTVWALKRLMRSREKGINETKRIKILEKRVLSSKTLLYLVEVDGEKVLIAESHLEIRPVQKITKELVNIE